MHRFFDFRAGVYRSVEVDEEDMFAQPRQETLYREPSRITCRVCERQALADDARPILCTECARDPRASAAHIDTVIAGHHRAVDEAFDALTAAIPDDPHDAIAERFANYQAALGTDKARQAEDAARRGVTGALANLIRLWLNYQQALMRLSDREAWAHRARQALDMVSTEEAR